MGHDGREILDHGPGRVNLEERNTTYITKEKSTYGLESRYRAPSGGIGSDNPLDDWGIGLIT